MLASSTGQQNSVAGNKSFHPEMFVSGRAACAAHAVPPGHPRWEEKLALPKPFRVAISITASLCLSAGLFYFFFFNESFFLVCLRGMFYMK